MQKSVTGKENQRGANGDAAGRPGYIPITIMNSY